MRYLWWLKLLDMQPMLARLTTLSSLQISGLLIAVFSLLRLFVGAASGLSVDEAHYALYGLHLDWSYFDHPPLVGWLQAAMLLFSDSTLSLRLIPIALFAATGFTLHILTRRLFPNESPYLGCIAVALLQSALMFQLLGMAMLPDTPLLLIGLLFLISLQYALNEKRLRDWGLLGLLLGLAGLAKYTAITLGLTAIIAVSFTHQWRQFLTLKPWLAIALALLCFTPIVYWNWQHDWLSFAYQLHHGTGDLHWKLRRWVTSEFVQLLAYGIAVIGFSVFALIAARRELHHDGVRYCLALSLPILLLFGWNAGYEMTLPHWTALAWVGLLPLTARWIYQRWTSLNMRIAAYLAAAYAVLLMTAVMAEIVMPRWHITPHPLHDLYGWQAASAHAQTLRRELAKTAGEPPVLFTENWTHASRLAWYARPDAVIVLDSRVNQFDLWFGAAKAHQRGVLMLPDAEINPAIAVQFSACVWRDKLEFQINNQTLTHFNFYICNDFKS
jgi:4-amino-4-deoxy-L-arabinose transferase-like glycosyltransferase